MPDEQKPNGPHARELGRINAELVGLTAGVGELQKDMKAMQSQFTDFRQRFFVMGALVLGIGIGIGVMISPALANVLIKLLVPV